MIWGGLTERARARFGDCIEAFGLIRSRADSPERFACVAGLFRAARGARVTSPFEVARDGLSLGEEVEFVGFVIRFAGSRTGRLPVTFFFGFFGREGCSGITDQIRPFAVR